MNGIDARWFDGKSSRAHDVRLRLAAPGMIEIGWVDADAPVECWPLAETTVSPRLGSAPRILRRRGHGHLECADSPLFDTWFPAGGGWVERSADWLERRRAAIMGAALATVALMVGAIRFGVPAAAEFAAERMPKSVERHVTDQALALLMRAELEPTRLPAQRRERLVREFRALVAGEPRAGEMVLGFVHAKRLGANAFAMPDGRIFATDALVELAGSDEQLLAVLAHEAGHHVHRHAMRGALESSSVFLLAGMLFGDVSGSSLAVSLPAALLSNGFSRGHEHEADAYAFGLLKRHGYSPRAFAEIMRRLSKDMPAGLERGAVGYLSSHPPSPERIMAAEASARSD